jgi:metal-responsive CopG/Arc/MetJ family transcriptional regulator
MAKAKIAISLDEETLERLDRLVKDAAYRNRSRAIEAAVSEKLERMDRTRLTRECSKLDAKAEKSLAEEGLSEDLSGWPDY